MANYGDSTELAKMYASISDSVSSNLAALALNAADDWVDMQTTGLVKGSAPALVKRAATYWAYVFILKNLYDTSAEESLTANWYESQAEKLMASYINQNSAVDYDSPYSSSQTPTRVYSKRNARTVQDYDYEDNIDDTRWDHE